MGLQLQSNNREKIGQGGGDCLQRIVPFSYTQTYNTTPSLHIFEAYFKTQETSLHLCGTEIFYIFILTYTIKGIDSPGLSFNGNVDMFGT